MTKEEFDSLKPGDKVKIAEPTYFLTLGLPEKQIKWFGKTMTVKSIINDIFVEMEEDQKENDGHGWRWDMTIVSCKVADKREHIEDDKISIYIRGNKTIATHDKKVGVARCAPIEAFNEAKGVIIAVARLYGYEVANEDDSRIKLVHKPRYKMLPWGRALKIAEKHGCCRHGTIWGLDKLLWENVRKQCATLCYNISALNEACCFRATSKDDKEPSWFIPRWCVKRLGTEKQRKVQ